MNNLSLDGDLAEGADYRVVRSVSMGGGHVWLLASDLRIDSEAEEMVVLSTRLLSAGPGANSVNIEADLPDASSIVYSAGAVWASRGTSNGLRVDPLTDAVEDLSTSLITPFGDAQGRILFAHQGSNSQWQLDALDPTTGSISVIATMPSGFTDTGSLVGGTWDETSSSAWLINEKGDILKVGPSP